MWRNTVLAIFKKKLPIKFNQEPCFGVNSNSKRFGTEDRYFLVSAEICAE
jgi:hypothetical protein